MSTHTNIHFCDGDIVRSNIYCQHDGYPKTVLADFADFFGTIKAELNDTRFWHSEQLAAKFVVWLAEKSAMKPDFSGDEVVDTPADSRFDFTDIGICIDDHDDIAFVYEVDCSSHDESGYPKVRWRYAFSHAWNEGLLDKE